MEKQSKEKNEKHIPGKPSITILRRAVVQTSLISWGCFDGFPKRISKGKSGPVNFRKFGHPEQTYMKHNATG